MNLCHILCLTPLFLAGAAFGAEAKFESACTALIKAQVVDVVALPVPVEPIRFQSVKDIALLGAHASEQPDAVIFGVTMARPEFALEYSLDTLVDPKTGLACVVPSVSVHLAYAPISVVIAQELSKDECMLSAAKLHEAEHVAAYQAHLESIRPALRMAIQGAVGQHVMYSTDPDVSDQISRRLDATLEPIVRQHYRLVDQKHAEIDSAAHLESFRLSCSGRINNLAYRIIQERSL